ncbi:MAG: CsgG/HfaB family protein [bacterium]
MLRGYPKTFWLSALLLAGLSWGRPALAAEKWHKSYARGLEAMERKDWQTALNYFANAIQEKSEDKSKTRAYGAVFIEYFPNREMGICYFHLGDAGRAREMLELSLQQSASERAREYLSRMHRGQPVRATEPAAVPARESRIKPTNTPSPAHRPEAPIVTLVGDRLSIAILPFETKGVGREIGPIDVLDKLTTVFVNLNRFKVIERAQLEKILAEQKLGLSGVIDVGTAAEIGKGIGVDAVVCGSISHAGNTASIDARLVDTESAAIISAQDAFANNLSLPALSQMISDVAVKIKNETPLVHGYVINTDRERLTFDFGRTNGMRKGMKCVVYRQGAPIVHPITNEVIGKMIDELCEAQLTEVLDGYSFANITKAKSGAPQIRDRVITK